MFNKRTLLGVYGTNVNSPFHQKFQSLWVNICIFIFSWFKKKWFTYVLEMFWPKTFLNYIQKLNYTPKVSFIAKKKYA